MGNPPSFNNIPEAATHYDKIVDNKNLLDVLERIADGIEKSNEFRLLEYKRNKNLTPEKVGWQKIKSDPVPAPKCACGTRINKKKGVYQKRCIHCRNALKKANTAEKKKKRTQSVKVNAEEMKTLRELRKTNKVTKDE